MRFILGMLVGLLFLNSSNAFAQQRTITFKGVADVNVYPDTLVYQEYFVADGDSEEELKETYEGYQKDIRNTLKDKKFSDVKVLFFPADQGGTGQFNNINLPGFFIPNHIRRQDSSEFQTRYYVKVVVDGVSKANFDKKCQLMRDIYSKIRESEVPLGNPNQNRNMNPFRGMVQDNQFRSKILRFKGWTDLTKSAFADAKKKADLMAAITGGKVGKVITVRSAEQKVNQYRSGFPMVYNSTYQIGNYQTAATTYVGNMETEPKNIFANGLTPHRFVTCLEVTFELESGK